MAEIDFTCLETITVGYSTPADATPTTPLKVSQIDLQYKYSPETPWAPIHEVSDGRVERIKKHYCHIWDLGTEEELEQLPTSPNAVFEGPEVTITAQDVESFTNVTLNKSDVYRASNARMEVPMDFSIKLGWKAIMKPLFPKSVPGDLLALVGDVVVSEAKIASITNSETGKTVSVKGTVFLLKDGAKVAVMDVLLSFFYRGRFDDYDATFMSEDDPEYKVTMATTTDIATLTFKASSSYRYREKSVYSNVQVEGFTYLTGLGADPNQLVQVATITYNSSLPSRGNPVVEYLKRSGSPVGQHILFTNGGYVIKDDHPEELSTPPSNQAYSHSSSDWNPIHCNPYFASLASLPGTITHAMWSSAATRSVVERVAAEGHGSLVKSYDVSFTGMLLPNTPLKVELKHIGQTSRGNKLISVTTLALPSESSSSTPPTKVLVGTAEVAQAPTAYVFTGQGSQEQGMGLFLYNESAVAKTVWDEADRNLGEVYGFSIPEIVRNNPKEKVVHFGGIKGHGIRQRYMEMSYQTTDKDGNVKTLPLFGDIDLRTSQYTFSSPTGLLYATQFAHIALVVTEKAAFEDMREKGLVQVGAAFAGHSLGEYSALASMAGILPISSSVDVVFFRALREVVETISKRCNVLVEIVNFNVEGQQYVAAGELVALQTLTNVLNFLKIQNIDIAKLQAMMLLEEVKDKLTEIVDECHKESVAKEKKDGFIVLERGFASIPLPGIDVPFHSRYLWAGVMPFRAYLSKKLNPAHLNPELLIGKYIPNLIAEPFQISREYADRIYQQTNSPRLEKALKNWTADGWDLPENRNKLGYVIIVGLLAYQFASKWLTSLMTCEPRPVLWVQTQDRLFSPEEFNIQRLIESGPCPTLTGMAARTLKLKFEKSDLASNMTREILCISKNSKEIYYQYENEVEEAPEEAPAAASSSAAAPGVAAAPVAVAAPAASAGPAVAVPREPLKAVETLRVLIAQGLKKPLSEVPLSKAIKDLVGGKYTLQNELLGSAQAEFGSAPDKAEEMPLDELGAALGSSYSGTMGKHTSRLVSRLIGSKMPGGFGMSGCLVIMNRANPALLDYMQYYLDNTDALKGERYRLAKDFGQILLSNCREAIGTAPMYRDSLIESTSTIRSKEQTICKSTKTSLFEWDSEELIKSRTMTNESNPGHEKSWILNQDQHYQGRIIELNDEEIGMSPDDRQSVFDMIHKKPDPNSVPHNPLISKPKGVRVCRECLTIVLRRQSMTYPIDLPEYLKLYSILKQLQDEIERSLPEFQEMMINSKSKALIPAERIESNTISKENEVLPFNSNSNSIQTSLSNQTNQDFNQLNVLLEQERLVEGYLEEANSRRQLEDSVSLKISLIEFAKLVTKWVYSSKLTTLYLDVLTEIASAGTTFEHKNALLTGVGKGSIGVEILKGLLSGGAQVVVTTSRYSRATVEY
ncbi:uncharacterized protein MELLADRAFT_79679 [Melampsora larici-populina 98AG31]|uniref:Malonyl-CoA:ACP transacylase (MAT) domain-containing protein n=1 Tax=Melampsora larici-populina (strain 98AG31 / pathotype 3-4-7) TaxID=747676 RepID=F4S9Z4_MELLP|nr:uncharacterized protein MELLADRAFT_79679 [Melampsora larici-populina 98AG31]EGF98545.1 hypothetical protein MELLADRAFT_79679 [Melampsora larici-populina 98AG31]